MLLRNEDNKFSFPPIAIGAYFPFPILHFQFSISYFLFPIPHFLS
jgi:hypothetical protein